MFLSKKIKIKNDKAFKTNINHQLIFILNKNNEKLNLLKNNKKIKVKEEINEDFLIKLKTI